MIDLRNIRVGDVFIPMELTYCTDVKRISNNYKPLTKYKRYRIVEVNKSPVGIQPMVIIIDDDGVKARIDIDFLVTVNSSFEIVSLNEERVNKIKSLL